MCLAAGAHFLVGTGTAAAQETDTALSISAMPPDYRWMRFSQLPDGLISSDVWSIAASDDAIWVGTDRGVSVYNGVWHNFVPAEQPSVDVPDEVVPSGTVLSLFVDIDGEAVHVGTDLGVVYVWDGSKWSVFADIGAPITALFAEPDTVLAGTDSGLRVLASDGAPSASVLEGRNINSLARVNDSLYAGTSDGLWQMVDQEWQAIPLDGAGSRGVYAISDTGRNGLAVGTPDGVVVLNQANQVVEQLAVTDELQRSALVQALASDQSGRLWAGTDGAGAYEFAAETYTATAHGQAHDANVTIRYVRDVTVDTDGSVWFATPTGVYRYQVGMWYSDVQGDSVANPLNHINDLLVASDNTLWVATGGGGIRHKASSDGSMLSNAETVFGVQEGVPSTVLVLEEDDAGNVWAGTFYGLFRYADDEWTLPEFNRSLPDLTVTTLLYDRPNLWIGTESGLAQYYSSRQTLRTVDVFDGIGVEALALDGLGHLWVGTNSAGAWMRGDDGEWIQHIHDDGDESSIPGDYIIGNGLAADWREPGHMWALVSREGLVHWDGSGWNLEEADNQIPVNLLWMLSSERDPGRLWIGSEGGVTQFDGRTWGTLSQDDGLQSATAYAIARTAEGGHWIGGATGLTYYIPDETPPWVRVVTRGPEHGGADDIGISVPLGEEIGVTVVPGDLQTLQPNLYLMQRIVAMDSDELDARTVGDAPSEDATGVTPREEWVQSTAGAIAIPSLMAGEHELQLMVRDQSFNYSKITRMPIEVFVPPPTVNVPGLGAVDPSIFTVLVILGAIAVLGAGYVLFGVLKRRSLSVEALNRGFNPYISGEPVRNQEMFFGRRDLVQRIADTLHNNSVMIHGERRIGKTTLLYQLGALLRAVDDPEYWFVPVYVDLEGTPQDHFFHLLIEEIVVAASRLPGAKEIFLPQLSNLRYRTVEAKAYDDRAFHRDLHLVSDVLTNYGHDLQKGKQLRLILLLDEMDVMSRYDPIVQQQLRRIFMREFASTVGAVVAGIRISKEWDRIESPWYNMFNEIELEPFTEEDANALLIEPVAGYYRYEDDALEFILSHSEGRPYRVQQYGLEAVNHMLARRRRYVKVEDAEEAHQRIVSTPHFAESDGEHIQDTSVQESQ